MDLANIFNNLIIGFGVAISPIHLLYALIGVMLGTLIGVLPGIGPVATIAMLLPITFNLSPVAALIMLAGIYYGAQYGGLHHGDPRQPAGRVGVGGHLPDGYQMARQGRAGRRSPPRRWARSSPAASPRWSSVAPPLAEVALKFGPAEYFSLMVLGLVAATVLAHGSLTAGDCHGGARPAPGADRHRRQFRRAALHLRRAGALRRHRLRGGGDGRVRHRGDHRESRAGREGEVFTAKVGRLMPTREDIRRATSGGAARHGARLVPRHPARRRCSRRSAPTRWRRSSKHPEQFGKGAIEGVAGLEAANNAGAQTSFIPMLTLGIPGNAVMALMIGALMIQGIAPGPQVMNEKPQLFWGLIASMWVGNLMLVVLNLPLIGMWIKLLTVPYRYLYPAILVFMSIGVFSLSNNLFDVLIMAIFGILGYIWVKLECEPAPLILGFILGPLMEENLRRAMLLSRGDPTTFITKPISAGFIVASVILLVIAPCPRSARSATKPSSSKNLSRSPRWSGSRSGIAPGRGGR